MSQAKIFGDTFAKYVKHKGGLVMCVFADIPANRMSGKWEPVYYPFNSGVSV